MNPTQEIKHTDIAIIGAGIATSYALLGIIEDLGRSPVQIPVHLRIIEKYPEMFRGIPYGNRSGNTVLLINSLKSFIPQPQRDKFVAWLIANKQDLLDEFAQQGGSKAIKWIEDNRNSIDANNWEELFIPRFFFGRHISEVVEKAVEEAIRNGLITLSYIQGEVYDVKKHTSFFQIEVKDGQNFTSKYVIISIGSLPNRKIVGNQAVLRKDGYVVLNELYQEDFSTSFQLIREFLGNRGNKDTNVLVLGANASGLEVLYTFTDVLELDSKITSYTVLSSQGVMPDSEIDVLRLQEYSPVNLIELQDKAALNADQIAHAAISDLKNAEKIDLGAASTVGVISEKVGNLLKRLDFEEAKRFACLHGNEIGRRQRCAGSHYINSVSELMSQKRLVHLAGRYVNLTPNTAENPSLILEYMAKGSEEKHPYDKEFHLVFNCMGSTDLRSADTPELLRNMMQNKLLTPNNSNIGFEVNHQFEASDGLYVIGPLLAGNVLDNKPLWHLEHCGRIIWSSGLMAKHLVRKFVSRDMAMS